MSKEMSIADMVRDYTWQAERACIVPSPCAVLHPSHSPFADRVRGELERVRKLPIQEPRSAQELALRQQLTCICSRQTLPSVVMMVE